MQKLNMVQAFVVLQEGTDATFMHPEGQAEQARLIKMRINAPQDVNLFLTPIDVDAETGEVTAEYGDQTVFLAHVRAGFDKLEFFFKGSFSLMAKGGDIWLDTHDNTPFTVEATDFTNYARLWEREERDPRILEIERAARHNQELLRQQMAADMARYVADMEERMRANVDKDAVDAGVGKAGDSSGKPLSAGTPAVDQAADSAPEAGESGEPDAAG